jgi:hypothetical protein
LNVVESSNFAHPLSREGRQEEQDGHQVRHGCCNPGTHRESHLLSDIKDWNEKGLFSNCCNRSQIWTWCTRPRGKQSMVASKPTQRQTENSWNWETKTQQKISPRHADLHQAGSDGTGKQDGNNAPEWALIG